MPREAPVTRATRSVRGGESGSIPACRTATASGERLPFNLKVETAQSMPEHGDAGAKQRPVGESSGVHGGFVLSMTRPA